MNSRFFDKDIARAYGLIVGIILGSLLLDLSGAGAVAPDKSSAAGGQSAPLAAGAGAAAVASSISQR